MNGEGISILTAATVTSVRRDTTGRSVVMRTAGERDREPTHRQIRVAAERRQVTGGLNREAADDKTSVRGEGRHWLLPAAR